MTEELTTIDEDVSNEDEYGSEATLDITISIDGATNSQKWMFAELSEMFEENFETLVNKNLNYGSAFLAGAVMEQMSDVPYFDDPVESALYRLHTRTDDKDQRFEEIVFGDEDDRVEEDAAEAALDNANYWILKAWVLEHGEENAAMMMEEMGVEEIDVGEAESLAELFG